MSQQIDIATLRSALGEGAPRKVRALIEAGADIHYKSEHGYNALIDAVHGRYVLHDVQLIDLLRLLIEHGVDLSAVSSFGESGLRVLSGLGRFDAVRLLVEAGADERQLEWTPLIRAVALGSLDDLRTVLDTRPDLEERDRWERTAWLVAVLMGDIAKATLLRDVGARTDACGRCDQPPLFYAIHGHHPDMLQWLLRQGADVHQTSDGGYTALMQAVEQDDVECVRILLQAGADVAVDNAGTALERARSREIIMRLLEAGADPADADQREILGMGPGNVGGEDEKALEAVSVEDFRAGAVRRFGTRNPERMQVPFWEAMIRAGVSAYTARTRFEPSSESVNEPVWCATRFGQSWTMLPDGRVIQIAGEHEDHYDPDFCIYNDVFVHHPEGYIAIYGYPQDVFPPTDFHTATLVGDSIYIVGSLGYAGTRRFGETPVYRLDVRDFHIERLPTQGEAPGWIYEHRAAAPHEQTIRVWGGKITTKSGESEEHVENAETFVLDLKHLRWRREAGARVS